MPMPPVMHPVPNTLTSIYQFRPSPPLVVGQYVATLMMNNQAYEKRFEIRLLAAGAPRPMGIPLN